MRPRGLVRIPRESIRGRFLDKAVRLGAGNTAVSVWDLYGG